MNDKLKDKEMSNVTGGYTGRRDVDWNNPGTCYYKVQN